MKSQNSKLSARQVMDAYLSAGPLSADPLSADTQEGVILNEGQTHSALTREEALASVQPGELEQLQKSFRVLDRLIELVAFSISEEEFAASTVSEERIDRVQARIQAIHRQKWIQEAQARWEKIEMAPAPLKDPVSVLRQALALPTSAPARAMARQRPAEMKEALQAAKGQVSAKRAEMAQYAGIAADEAEDLARQFSQMAHRLRVANGHIEDGSFSGLSVSRGLDFQFRLQIIERQSANIQSLKGEMANQEVLLEQQQVLLEQQQSQEADPAWQAGREAAARSAVEQVCLPEDRGASPINLEKIAEDLGLFVKRAPLDGFEGCLVTDGTVGGILIDAGMTDVRRQRFTLAHEVGHFLMHRSQGDFHDTTEDMSDYQSELELEANLFASLLLIPDVLLPSTAEGLAFADVDRIAAACDVSLLAAARRLIRHLDRTCALVVLQGGQIRYYVGSRLFGAMGGHIRTKRAPHPDSAAAQVLADAGEGGQASKQIPASFWVAGGPLAEEGRNLQEESRCLEDGFTYALLTLVDEEGMHSND